MNKLIINGSFADEISRAIHHNDEKTPHFMNTTTVTADNESSKEYIAKMFTTCLGFNIVSVSDEYGNDEDNDGYIEFTVTRPQEDIDKFHEDRKHSLKYSIKRLKKWSDTKEEWKEQINTYLVAKKLDWIVEAMNS